MKITILSHPVVSLDLDRKTPGAWEISMARKKQKHKSPVCKTCGKRIYMPKDWTVGASVRKHYWRHHPEVMRGEG